MTNTLHRYGSREGLRNDYVVFALPCRGRNDKGSVPKLREFLRREAEAAATKTQTPLHESAGRIGAARRETRDIYEKTYRRKIICDFNFLCYQPIAAKRLITRLLKERVINHINTCCSISFNNKRIQRIKTANRSLLKNPTFRCIWICILKVSEIWRIFEITIHA